jgi:hypothetical protein
MSDRDDLNAEFDRLSMEIAAATGKVENSYFTWTNAVEELRRLERLRSAIWERLIETVSQPEGRSR